MSELTPREPETYTVLCVDDEINILKAIKRVLHKQDYELLIAQSGAEALEILNVICY